MDNSNERFNGSFGDFLVFRYTPTGPRKIDTRWTAIRKSDIMYIRDNFTERTIYLYPENEVDEFRSTDSILDLLKWLNEK